MWNPMDLSKKKIVITGATGGIGKAVCRYINALGAKVIMLARNEEKLRLLSKELKDHTRFYTLDFTNISEIENTFKEIVNDNGKLDGLVHCAGINEKRPINLLNSNDLNKMMCVNFYSFITLSKLFANRKNNNSGGSIVALSSISSHRGYKAKTAYCSSKSALDSSVRALSSELASKKIRVNTVTPAGVNSEMYDEYLEQVGIDVIKNDLAKQPLGLVEKEDVAAAAAFLLSDASKGITGTTIVVDGGRLATD